MWRLIGASGTWRCLECDSPSLPPPPRSSGSQSQCLHSSGMCLRTCGIKEGEVAIKEKRLGNALESPGHTQVTQWCVNSHNPLLIQFLPLLADSYTIFSEFWATFQPIFAKFPRMYLRTYGGSKHGRKNNRPQRRVRAPQGSPQFCRTAGSKFSQLRAPSSTPTPKTPQTRTMVCVVPPQKLRPWSEFLLSLRNTESGVVWVLVRVFLGPYGLSFLPRRQKHWGRGRRMSIEKLWNRKPLFLANFLSHL